ncbi:MAG: hypothetical protein WC881_04180 [Elusimicrobiota bacterium]|jgi:hypothetical protein
MRGLLLSGALWLAAAGAGSAANHAADKQALEPGGRDLLAAPDVQWLKIYPLPIYKERWRMELAVSRMDQAMPRVRQAFTRAGAAAGDQETPASAKPGLRRKLSYHCMREAAREVVRELRKIGRLPEPRIEPVLEPVALPEVRAKILQLTAEREAHGPELANMPAVALLVEELLGHLRGVEASLRKTEVEIILSVREQR